MSRLPSRVAALLLLVIPGCMNQPMYQPYPYGQPMYAPQNGYTQPGTIVIPPSGTVPYPPGGTYDTDPASTDPFKRDSGSGTGQFFGDDAGGVPPAKDPATDGTTAPVDRDFPNL